MIVETKLYYASMEDNYSIMYVLRAALTQCVLHGIKRLFM